MLASNDVFETDDELLRFYNYARMYREARAQLMGLPADENEKKLHQLLTAKTRVAQPINVTAAEYLMDEDADPVQTRDKVTAALINQKELIDLLNTLVFLLRIQSEAALADTQKSYVEAENLSIILNTIMVILGLMITFGITRYVHRNNQMLNKALLKAKAAAKSKSEFLANMSHEIRTPMNGVLGMLYLLRESNLDNSQKEMTIVAHNSANSLLTVINDILDFSKIEAGKLKFEIIDYNLHELIEEVVELYQENCKKKSVDLFCDISPDLCELLKGDPTRVRQLITNLINNAIKFTEQGEIKISLNILSKVNDDIELKISVKDTGIGISNEKQGEIFESFSQADGSTTRKYGGTGLGLTICKQLAFLADGDIGVDSQLGNGSTFWFTMKTKIVASSKAFIADERLKNYRGVVYLPNENILEAVRRMLKHWGIELFCYSEKNEFLDNLSSDQSLDFIIFDEHAKQALDHVVIDSSINLICVKHDHAKKECFIGNKLCHTLNYNIRRNILHQALLKSYLRKEKLVVNDSMKMDHLLNILIVDDMDVNLIVIQSFLKKYNLTADTAMNGLDAVEKSFNKKYDLIFMDCQMPVLNGYDATLAIREHELKQNKPRCPIIAMTANVMKEDRDKCFESDMDDFIPKPVEMNIFIEKIKAWSKSQLVQTKNAKETPKPNLALANKFGHNVRIDEITEGLSYDEIEHLLNIFKNDCEIKNDKFKIFRLDQFDHNAIDEQTSIFIHSLKGTAANMGFISLSELCKVIEHAISINNTINLPYLFDKLDIEIKDALIWVGLYIESKTVD